MSEPRRFDLRELGGADDAGGDQELGRAFSVARALESALAGPDARPSPELADRIMAAVAKEPAPRPTGILASLVRRPGVGGLVESLRVAWTTATRWGSPIGPRAGALAYVLAVLALAVALSGTVAYTTAGALGWLGSPSEAPISSPLPATTGPLASPRPSGTESLEPTESPEPSGPEPSDDRVGPGTEPGDSGSGGGSDGSVGPGATDDGGGDGSSGSTVNEPSTPRPSQTPAASGAARPTSTD